MAEQRAFVKIRCGLYFFFNIVTGFVGQRVGGLRSGPTGGYLDMVETGQWGLEDVNSGPYLHPRCYNDHEFDDKGDIYWRPQASIVTSQ